MVITKIRQLKSLTLIVLIRKKPSKFVGGFQTMINNNASKSIRSLVGDVGVSEFIIRQLMSKDIWYFSYKIKKGQFLSHALKDNVKRLLQSFWTNWNTYSIQACFLPGSDGEFTEQPLAFSVSIRWNNSDENQTSSSHHGVWGGHWRWWHHALIYLPT